MAHEVLLKKIENAEILVDARYTPASYDVLVNGLKVGTLVGKFKSASSRAHWHDLKDLDGRYARVTVGVRGVARERLDREAIRFYELLQQP
ncbi:hypothetical protein RBE51_20515 [Pseudomonas taiwanensis]|uniref:hypothetical protein n=1 Tax=Pseudomonas taiwanensis TaxID=470150 RepID=UPI0028DDE03F|nr:hypothetical protein [Pseudomonas taiwanensis]MDT8925179.1 hypothetical protein [Pseudomonas taiwanensis]